MAFALCLSISWLGSSFVAVQGSASTTRPRAAEDVAWQPSECSPAWLPTFGAPGGADRTVFTLASAQLGAERELFAGGWFNNIDGLATNRIARLASTGWETLGSGLSGNTSLEMSIAMLEHDDGHGSALFVGGEFNRAGGVAAPLIARWDGSAWSAVGASSLGVVLTLAEHELGGVKRLFAGGWFRESDGHMANGLAMWDGNTWSPLGTGTDDGVFSMASFDDGTGPALYASGPFTSAGGVPASCIARWDGAQWSPVGLGLDGPAHSMVVHDDGRGPRLYVGGEFTQAGGQPARNLACWDGTSWSEVGGGTDNPVVSLAVYPEAQGEVLIAGGCFGEAGGIAAEGVARWDGSSWGPLGAGLEGGCVMALTTHVENGQVVLYAGGEFFASMTQDTVRIARWNGTNWSPLRSGVAESPSVVATVDTGSGPKLHMIRRFGWKTWLLRREASGWEGVDWFVNPPRQLVELELGTSKDLYLTGYDLAVNGSHLGSIARRENGAWVAVPGSPDGEVDDLAVFDEGTGPRLFACGYFSNAGGVTAPGIARWDGVVWSSLGSGLSPASAYSMVPHEENGVTVLYVTGSFTRAGGRPANHVARWDGVAWSPLAGGLDQDFRLVSFDSGHGPELYAYGRFKLPGSNTFHELARWDGLAWQLVATPLTNVSSAILHDDGGGRALFLSGYTSSGDNLLRALRWDGASWTALGSGLIGSRASLASTNLGSGPALLAFGDFVAPDSGDENMALWGCVDTRAPRLDLSPQFVADGWTDGPGEIVALEIGVTDEDPSPHVEFSPPSGSFFLRGTTLVTCTATDASGNVATGQFALTVQPKLRPR